MERVVRGVDKRSLLRVTGLAIALLGSTDPFQAYPAWTDNNLEIPLFGVDQDTPTGFADLYFQPINLGWSFLEGAANVGVAYAAQWKVTHDDLGGLDVEQLLADLGLDISVGRNRVFGIGPEVSFPIATRKKLIALLGFRYLWETGARTSLEGESFTLTATFPIPSVPLQ